MHQSIVTAIGSVHAVSRARSVRSRSGIHTQLGLHVLVATVADRGIQIVVAGDLGNDVPRLRSAVMATAVGEIMHIDVTHDGGSTGSSAGTQGTAGIELRVAPSPFPALTGYGLARHIGQPRHHGRYHYPCVTAAALESHVNGFLVAIEAMQS